MALTVGGTPVKSVYVGSTPVKAVYVGSQKVWPTIVQITGTSGMTSRNQLRDAVTALGLNYRTVTHLPFEIDTSQATSLLDLFNGWTALVVAPEMTTPQVTDMGGLFRGCTALEYVGDLQTSNVTNAGYMFNACPALTDGNVRLLGKHPNVSTTAMIANSGLTREPWYTADGQPWPLVEVHEVSLTDVTGSGTAHPLLTVTVPAGETWRVRIQGTMTRSSNVSSYSPFFRIGTADSGTYKQDAVVDFSGTVNAANSTIAMVTGMVSGSFTGTVTIEK